MLWDQRFSNFSLSFGAQMMFKAPTPNTMTNRTGNMNKNQSGYPKHPIFKMVVSVEWWLKNGCFTKHPLENGCFGYQDRVATLLLFAGFWCWVLMLPMAFACFNHPIFWRRIWMEPNLKNNNFREKNHGYAPKVQHSPWKVVVGKLRSRIPFGMVTFQGRTVKLRGGKGNLLEKSS